jgi:hypothetical protein
MWRVINATGNSVGKYRFSRIVTLQRAARLFQSTVAPLEHSAGEEARMRRDDLMKPDLVSEVVLVGSGMFIVVLLILTVVAALVRIAPLQ